MQSFAFLGLFDILGHQYSPAARAARRGYDREKPHDGTE
jgi:hypothetical protein